jgi:hypothetical protein
MKCTALEAAMKDLLKVGSVTKPPNSQFALSKSIKKRITLISFQNGVRSLEIINKVLRGTAHPFSVLGKEIWISSYMLRWNCWVWCAVERRCHFPPKY